jgi:hypothetical protein
MRNKCDVCGTNIENGKCSCGTWLTPNETKDLTMKKALEEFHEMKKFVVTGDMPHLGCAVVYFRGDQQDCEKVSKFIFKMKGRPYYE